MGEGDTPPQAAIDTAVSKSVAVRNIVLEVTPLS
jgi:hypothetical protein